MRPASSVSPPTPRAAFSLIEMLVVLAVIGILVSVLIPAIGTVVKKGEKTETKALTTAIAQGLKAYRNDYKKWPPCLRDLGRNSDGDYALIVPASSSSVNATWTKLLITLTARNQSGSDKAIVKRNNPQFHTYFEPQPKNLNTPDTPLKATTILDGWERQLCLVVDGNGDGVIKNLPHKKNNTPNGFDTHAEIAIWSWGADTSIVKDFISTWD